MTPDRPAGASGPDAPPGFWRRFGRGFVAWFRPVAGAAVGSLNQKERQRVIVAYLVTQAGATGVAALAARHDVVNLVLLPTLAAVVAAALCATARLCQSDPDRPVPPCPTESSSSPPSRPPDS